jgi:hypothetical protein
MLQYFETLQDTSGNALVGATVTVTNYPSGSLATIYSSNGTASPITASLVTADTTGQVSFYLPDGAYTLTYAVSGTPYKIKSPVQMIDPMGFAVAGDTGAANAYVVTSSAYPLSLYTGLKVEVLVAHTNTGASTFNLNSTGAQPVIQPGGSTVQAGQLQAGGLYRFEWDGAHWQLFGVQSPPFYGLSAAEVAASVTPTNFSYPWGNVLRYGADPTNTLDTTAAVQAAVNQNKNAGATVTYAPGNFKQAGTVATGDNPNVYIAGAGVGATTITPTAAVGNLFTFGASGTLSQGISNLSVNSAAATSCTAFQVNNINGFFFNNVLVNQANIALQINSGVIQFYSNFQFQKSITAAIQVLGAGGGGNDQFFNFGVCSSAGVTQPTQAGMYVTGNGAIWCDNCDFISQGVGLLVQPGNGQQCTWGFFTNTAFDTNANTGVNIAPLSNGNVYGMSFTACWTASNTNSGFYASAVGTSGQINGLRVVAHRAFNNGLQGIVFAAGGTLTNFHVENCDCAGNSQTLISTYAGIEVGANLSGFGIHHNRSGQEENFGSAVQQSWGIIVDGGTSNNYSIIGNDVRGNNGTLSDGGTGTTKIVKDNLPYNPIAQTAITVTASPFTFTNKTGGPLVVYVQGGTTSAATTVNGQTVAASGATNFAATVPHGLAMIVTYTGAPTMNYQGV